MTKIKIGIDLDNTIINYQNSFKKYLSQKKIYLDKIDKNKIKSLLTKKKKISWTEAQEEIYGNFITFAQPYRYFKEFEEFSIKNEIKLFIISHKTKYSQFSKKYNLHSISNKWIKENIFKKKYKIIFLNSLSQKIKKIKEVKPKYFIDDLDEVLNHKDFPKKVNKIYFSKIKKQNLKKFENWRKIKNYIQNNETLK
jgi:hypothetical protein